jgi:hypothetical protein
MECVDSIPNSKLFSLLLFLSVSAMVVIKSQLITHPHSLTSLWGGSIYDEIIFMTIPESVKKPEVSLDNSKVPFIESEK